jgi:hypothetical protein
MFPVTAVQLQEMADNSKVCHKVQIHVIVHRIINEVFKNASMGNCYYTCDVLNDHAPELMKQLLTHVRGCSVTIFSKDINQANITIDWSC